LSSRFCLSRWQLALHRLKRRNQRSHRQPPQPPDNRRLRHQRQRQQTDGRKTSHVALVHALGSGAHRRCCQASYRSLPKQYPNVKIEFENVGSGTDYWIKLQTMIAGGTAPDVIYPATHNAYALASKNALVYVDDFAKRDKIDLAKYDPTVLDLYKTAGKVHCLPIDSAAVAVFYNKNMFDAAGVSYPKEGWTWDDYLATMQKLSKDTNNDGKIDQFGTAVWNSYWPVVVWSKTGHNTFDDPRNPSKFLMDDAAIEAIQYLGDLTNKYHVMPSSGRRRTFRICSWQAKPRRHHRSLARSAVSDDQGLQVGHRPTTNGQSPSQPRRWQLLRHHGSKQKP
jgi:hypothetical protein